VVKVGASASFSPLLVALLVVGNKLLVTTVLPSIYTLKRFVIWAGYWSRYVGNFIFNANLLFWWWPPQSRDQHWWEYQYEAHFLGRHS